MQEKSITIINKLGLHARAASKLSSLAASYQSDIQLSRDEKTVDAKSIMQVMMLAASQGCQININTDGEDEADAMNAIERLINEKFGEDE